jgi:hypothetical protein
MPSIPVDVVDAIELAELPGLLSDWLESDRAALGPSLARFISSTAYSIDSLHADFARFRVPPRHGRGRGPVHPPTSREPASRSPPGNAAPRHARFQRDYCKHSWVRRVIGSRQIVDYSL